MTIDVLLVDLAALAAVLWIVWYFWLAEKEGVRAVGSEGGLQEAFITVKGGYAPDVIRVGADRPVRLHFTRQETSGCSEQVQFPDFGISRTLPAGETVDIDLPPAQAGEYPFSCQMGMLRGKLVVTGNGAAGHDETPRGEH